MNGHVIPHTPIAVDHWRLRDCPHARLFFLSHLHGDHIAGLTSSWQHPIFCTPITAMILKLRHNIRENLIRPLELGVGHILYLDEEKTTTITVTLLDANHCPGACMFLFQGYFGNILYTGDFRYDKGVTESSPLREIAGNLHIIYLDNTYCLPTCSFPSRQKCFGQIVDIIRKFPDYNVVIGMRSLGKEDLLVKIALEFQEWIAISGKMFELVNGLNLPEVFTTDSSKCRIRVEPFHKISNKNISAWNEKSPTIAILPTALYCGLNMSPFINQDKVFVVPYSDHSSYAELLNFVSYLRPCAVRPIVSADSQGPFRISLADRADMTCFSKYLNKNMSVHTISTLESMRTLVFSHQPGILQHGQRGVKRIKSFRVSKSRIKKMGVNFENSPNKSNGSEIVKESSPGGETTPDMTGNTFAFNNTLKMKTIECVKDKVVTISPQDIQNPASITPKFIQKSNEICNYNTGKEFDQNCCSEETDPFMSEEVTSLTQSVDKQQDVNCNLSRKHFKEDESKQAVCCTSQSSVDMSCELHESPKLSKEYGKSFDTCRPLKSSNETLEAVDDDTIHFKNPLMGLSSLPLDRCDFITEDAKKVGQIVSDFAWQMRFSEQSANESLKTQLSGSKIMDQVRPLQNEELKIQSKSNECEVKMLAPKFASQELNTKDSLSSIRNTPDVYFLNVKDTNRLSMVNDERDSSKNYHDLQKASNCMTKSYTDVSDIPSDNNTNNFQNLKSNKPKNIYDRFQNFKSNCPNESCDKFQDFNSYMSSKCDKSKTVELTFDQTAEIQTTDIANRSVEFDSKNAANISEADVINKNYQCSCTERRCSLIKAVGTSFQTHGVTKSSCQYQHKDGTCQYQHKDGTCQYQHKDVTCQYQHKDGTCQYQHKDGTCQYQHKDGTCQYQHNDVTCQYQHKDGTCQYQHNDVTCQYQHKDVTCQYQHKEVDLSLSLELKDKALPCKESGLGSSFIQDSLDLDTDTISGTSHPYINVIVQKTIKTQVPRQSVKALQTKSTDLCQASYDAPGNQSSSSITDINLKPTSLASFTTKGELCRNTANSENRMQLTERGIVKGEKTDKERYKQKYLDLCTKENKKDSYHIVFTDVRVKPLNRDKFRNGRGSFNTNAN